MVFSLRYVLVCGLLAAPLTLFAQDTTVRQYLQALRSGDAAAKAEAVAKLELMGP